MPHAIVKLWPGPSEKQKVELSEGIVQTLVSTLNSSEDSTSVAFEEVPAQEWMAKVYRPDVAPNLDKFYEKPGYDRV
jgi:4-oxalocrotonate tautomerase